MRWSTSRKNNNSIINHFQIISLLCNIFSFLVHVLFRNACSYHQTFSRFPDHTICMIIWQKPDGGSIFAAWMALIFAAYTACKSTASVQHFKSSLFAAYLQYILRCSLWCNFVRACLFMILIRNPTETNIVIKKSWCFVMFVMHLTIWQNCFPHNNVVYHYTMFTGHFYTSIYM